MENKKNKKNCQIGNFCLELGKNILFGIRNGAEFRPQNQVIESSVRKYFTGLIMNVLLSHRGLTQSQCGGDSL